MQKVISINLNGHAYQLEEVGYEALRDYLARAERQLEGNADRAEIMMDLEQAIADKCHACLGAHKTVVTVAEVERIVADMGPVQDDAQANGKAGVAEPATGGTADEPPRRLFRVPAGATIAGVCTGLAAYFKIDVTLVRIAFVLAALVTQGAAILAYVVMMFVVPEATTPEQAGGPVNARDVVDRARQRSTEVGREWRRQWRRHRGEWRRQWSRAHALPVHPAAAAMTPVFGLAQMGLFLLTMAALISLVNTGAILDWELPSDVPVWAAAVVLLVAYQIVVSPLKAAQAWRWSPAAGPALAPFAFWSAIVWLIGIAFAIWLASNHIPEIREFVQRLPHLFRDFAWTMRDLAHR
jgi:phage shock protein PspC (stress-responsive transcriptional regulator)